MTNNSRKFKEEILELLTHDSQFLSKTDITNWITEMPSCTAKGYILATINQESSLGNYRDSNDIFLRIEQLLGANIFD